MPMYTKLVNGDAMSDITSPLRIALQILILQCFYYVLALVIFWAAASISGYDFHLDWVFLWELVDIENARGILLFILWLFDSLLCVLFVTLIVGRLKLAWDFALTIHIINLMVVWGYSGSFPTLALWWCLQVLLGVLLVVLLTYSTRWKELRQTFFDDMLERGERVVEPELIEMTTIEGSAPRG